MTAGIPGHRPDGWGFLETAATEAGFCAIGVAPADALGSEVADRFRNWLLCGQHADMRYLEKWDAVRWNPASSDMLAGASAVISVALPIGQGRYSDGVWSQIAVHARGRDYHRTLKEKLMWLAEFVRQFHVEAMFRPCVDSAPVPERTWASLCGLGVLGRNGALIVPGIGPKVLLGELICANVPNPPPLANPQGVSCDVCGNCVDACPTRALSGDGTLDARRCLAYHSVENRKDLPVDIASRMQSLFGCDICTSVCPKVNAAVDTGLEPIETVMSMPQTLEALILQGNSKLQRALSPTCMGRSGAGILKRNAVVLIRNS